MKTIIAGSRDIVDANLVRRVIEQSGFEPEITEVVWGMAPGVDELGKRWGHYRHIPVKPFPAKWKRPDGTTNRAAGFIRNQEMANYADALIAIWDGMSPGTADMIARARKGGLKIHIYNHRLKDLI